MQARPQRPAGPRFGPPLAVQIIALLVAVLIIGQVATFVVILVLPPPRPPVYRVEEIAGALKGERTAPRYGPQLIRSTPGAPPVERGGETFHIIGLKAQLSRLLGVSDDRVRLVIEARPFFAFPYGGRPRGRDGPPDDRSPADRPPGPPGPPGTLASPPGPMKTPAFQPGDDPPPWVRPGGRNGWRFGAGAGGDHFGFVVGRVEAAYQPPSGGWITVRSPSSGFPNAWERRLLLWFLACLLVLTPAGYLFARRLTAPISRFAGAAERLGRDPRAPPITLRGPAEIGLAAAAFNEMQARLARYVEDRTAMIAAIVHDLRTPLTRVQFKLQKASPEVAADIRTDLGQMEAMIAAVLAFVRDGSPSQERGPLDLLSLLEVVADDAGATGADVGVAAGAAVIVEGDASALQRLFVNLVDNAVKYGGRAHLDLFTDGGEAVVRITDDGPGLSDDERERVFEPFYRVETSRSRDTGGIGLGLSIARSIARAHGGDVTLEKAAAGAGLIAVVRLPVARASA